MPHLREEIVSYIQDVKPQIVITHGGTDYHPDHRATHAVVLESIEWASHRTLFNEQAWEVQRLLLMETHILHPFPHVYVDISGVIEQKQKAIEVFASQNSKLDNYYLEFTTSNARLRGIQAGTEYAEAFCVYPIPKVGNFYPTKSATLDLLNEKK